MKQKNILLFNSILLTIYLLGSVPFYITSASNSLEGHPIFGAIYVYIIVIHEVFILLAALCQWIGYFNKSRGWIRLANWTMIIGGIIGVILVVPIFVIIPIILINVISRNPKKSLKSEQKQEI